MAALQKLDTPTAQTTRAEEAQPMLTQPLKRRYYTVPEVQEILGLDSGPLYKGLREGDLPSILIGGRRLIPVSAIDRLEAAAG
jgi:hypothetical protein